MGVVDLAVLTNHPFNTYTAGQSVRGKVHFTLDSPQSVRGVYVKFGGIAKVNWTEVAKTEYNDEAVPIWFYGAQEYFDKKIYLIGEANGDCFKLEVGNYNYKFEYALPIGLPTSYEGTFGGVIYNIAAGLDKPGRVDDEETVTLKIRAPLDLNTLPHLKKPGYVRCSKHICCLWCLSGPLTLEMYIPKTGYTIGETILIKGDTENLTNSVITMLKFELKQIISFISEFPHPHTKCIHNILASVEVQGGIAIDSSKVFEERIEIPEHSVLNFNNCNVLDVQYELKVTAKFDGNHNNLMARIPIKIGNIPLKFNSRNELPISILADCGTPYPYETEQKDISENMYNECSNTYNQYSINYGRRTCSGSNIFRGHKDDTTLKK